MTNLKPYRERWREVPSNPSEEDELYDLYEPVTEDELFDFVDNLEDLLAEGALRQFEEVLGDDCKFARRLWVRTQGIDIYLTVEKK